MIFLFLACTSNVYFSSTDSIQFSLSGSDVVELETMIDKSLTLSSSSNLWVELVTVFTQSW